MVTSNTIQHAFRQSLTQIRQCVVLMVLLSPAFVKAQRQKVYTNVIWIGYNNKIQLAKKFTFNSELQIRTREWTPQIAQEAILLGISYKPSSKFNLSAGGSWFRQAQYFTENTIYRKEWRPYQDISYQFKEGKVGVQQRLRLEQRFIQQIIDGRKTSDYNYLPRLRYRLELQLPLEGGRFTPTFGNETMVYPAFLGSNRFLDQTRTYVGVNTKLSTSTMLQLQYLKTFQWRATDRLEDQNAVRVYVYQQFNLRK